MNEDDILEPGVMTNRAVWREAYGARMRLLDSVVKPTER